MIGRRQLGRAAARRLILVWALAGWPAAARDRPAGDAPDGDPVPDIVVTAERRGRSVRDVPIAVTALPAARIATDAMLNLDRIGATVPNLYLARNFGTSSGALVFLRGVGEGDSIFTNDPPVGITVDDVIVPRSTGALFDLIDLERIEVLRGPQGTLYGRNTSGGAIRLVTRRPEPGLTGGLADVAVGSYGRFDARVTVNLPLGRQAALRLSGLSRNQRGWGLNLTDGRRVNGQQVAGGRAALLWNAGETTTLFATADLTVDRSGPRFPQRFLPNPAAPGRFTDRFAAPEGDIDRFTSADTSPLGLTDTGGLSLRIEQRLPSGATLTAITGRRALRSRIGFDQTANAPGQGANVILLQDQHQWNASQEIQLAATALDGRIELVAGLYWFAEHNRQLTAVSFATPIGQSAARFRNHDFFAAPSRANGNWSPYEPRLDTGSRSAFASATARLGRDTRLTVGARYTDEGKRYGVRFLSAPGTTLVLPDGRPAAREIEADWQDLSPRLALDHRVGGDGAGALIYASIAKGFRSGSFDGRARNIDFALTRQGPIAPETLWSREAGVKADLLDRRLQLNVAYFINDYTDIAFSAARAGSTPPEIFRQNVGDARIRGLEAEWTARPVAGLELSGWIATLADRFTRLASSPRCAGIADERALDLRFTPAFRYQLRALWTRDVGPGRLRIGGDYMAASPYNIALCNEPQHRVTDAASLNMQIGFAVADWDMTLAATNLTDRRYNSGSVGTIGYPVAPRELLLRMARRF